ncbi:MAG: nitroreductase family protein [Bacteroidales bacterium]|nr:nitroreductase family protein [Bacteroidales bacterium]
MNKKANNEFPMNSLSEQRWSPRSFKNQKVEKEKLQSIFEAARWSASAYNGQPWRFLVGFQGDKTYNLIYETLVEFNQQWAGKAPVLILNCYQIHFTHNGALNLTAEYDLGQAVANYSLEAINQGLYSHQMTGFDSLKAESFFGLGEEVKVFSVTALGYLGDADDLTEDFKKMETSERKRINQSAFLLNKF